MSADITDKFTSTFNSENPNSARVTSSRTSGVTTLSCDNLAGWPTDTAVHFATYQIDTNNDVVQGTQIDWKGIVSGNNIGSLVRKAGAVDNGNSIGDVVEMLPTGSWAQDLKDGISTSIDQDGTLKAGAVDNAGVLASNVVTTAKILDANVTTAKLATGIQVATKEQNPYNFSGYLSGAQNAGNAAFAVINFDAEEFDTGSNFDIVTNKGRFTAPIAGFYEFSGSIL